MIVNYDGTTIIVKFRKEHIPYRHYSYKHQRMLDKTLIKTHCDIYWKNQFGDKRVLGYGVAKQSKFDTYDRILGKYIALGRALDNAKLVKTIDNLIYSAFKQEFCSNNDFTIKVKEKDLTTPEKEVKKEINKKEILDILKSFSFDVNISETREHIVNRITNYLKLNNFESFIVICDERNNHNGQWGVSVDIVFQDKTYYFQVG